MAIFRELGSTGNYLRGVLEKLNFFRDLGSKVIFRDFGRSMLCF